jgi:hypothetical protein
MNLLTDSLSYPLRGSGKYLLITVAVLSVGADLVSFAPIIGLVAWLLLFGYLCGVYFQIIQSTATGDSEAPLLPDTSNIYEDILSPALQVIAVIVVSFLPAIVATYMWRGDDNGRFIVSILHMLGIFYAPMAILGVAVLGFLGASSPHIVIPAIFRCGGLYLLVVGALVGLYFVEGAVSVALGRMFIIRSLVLAVVGAYVMMANGRMLGLMFRCKRDHLNWI